MVAASRRIAMTIARAHALTFKACYDAHWDRVFHLCLRYGGGNAAWAEDVAHDVFIKLLEHLPSLDTTADLGGWLYRVAANQALSRLRRDRSWMSRLGRMLRDREEATDATPESLLQQHRLAAEAVAALGELPPRERVVLTMKLYDGLPQQEIARTLGMSKGYVSKLVARGLERLRAAGWGVDDGPA
jgi:RNA polymerase sigma factor (sigma-70 family)